MSSPPTWMLMQIENAKLLFGHRSNVCCSVLIVLSALSGYIQGTRKVYRGYIQGA